MSVNREWVGKVRGVLGANPESLEPMAQRFEWFDHNRLSLEPPLLDQSPKARAIREINRISERYGWGREIRIAQDRAGVASPEKLSEDAVFELLERMRWLQDAIQTACDPEDSPPAW